MLRGLLLAFLLTFAVSQSLEARARFDNYEVYRVLPRTLKHLDFLAKLEPTSESIIFLNSVTTVGRDVNILVAPHKKHELLNILDDNEISHYLVDKNFQTALDAEEAEMAEYHRRRSETYDWKGYHTLEETYEWLKSLEQRFPNIVKTIVAGTTYEGRQILGVRVSFKSGNKGIFIEGGIHSREWIAPATVTYILNEILTSQDQAVRDMAQSYDWYIFPHVNPDGYVYTHTHNRLWRKTRSKGTRCDGADPNRNCGFKWLSVGASDNECSETFAGKSEFSEIEIRTLMEYVTGLKDQLAMYVAFHSYSQLLLYAYGYTPDRIPNYDHHKQIGEAAAAALARRYGTQYKVGDSYTTIYPTSGSTRDYAYGVLNIPLVWSYELRPTSSAIGFILPSAQIIPTGEETLDSLVAIVTEGRKLGYL